MIVYVKLLQGSSLHLYSVSPVAARVLSIQESWVHMLARTLSFVAVFLCIMSVLLGYSMGRTVRETMCFPLHHFTTILTVFFYINKC